MKKGSANQEEFSSIIKVLNDGEIKTSLNESDLVLPIQTEQKIEEIDLWLNEQKKTNEKFQISKGHTCLFYGKALTEKILTTAILAKKYHLPFYRVDVSGLVSKFIGETEKNLEKILNRAEQKGAILFFDEADALFGKRTQVQDSHDKFANVEVSYLLQKIEECKSLIILSANLKRNIDDAFLRRFNCIIQFPKTTRMAKNINLTNPHSRVKTSKKRPSS